MSEHIDIDDLRARFLGEDFDVVNLQVNAEQIVDYAKACGEQAPRYTDPEHPDFQAPPTFSSSFESGRRLPDNFPRLPGLGMDAGKAVSSKKPIRPGVPLVGRTHLHDVYAKTGRSGRMVFMVTRMEIYDPDGEQLATADTRVVIRERPAQ